MQQPQHHATQPSQSQQPQQQSQEQRLAAPIADAFALSDAATVDQPRTAALLRRAFGLPASAHLAPLNDVDDAVAVAVDDDADDNDNGADDKNKTNNDFVFRGALILSGVLPALALCTHTRLCVLASLKPNATRASEFAAWFRVRLPGVINSIIVDF